MMNSPTNNSQTNKDSRKKGFQAEESACKWLESKGFEIIERNFFASVGEIDIIAKKDAILHFIEVKSGKNFNPIYAITPHKLQKIYKSIEVYFFRNQLESNYCVDALIVKKLDSKLDYILLENISL